MSRYVDLIGQDDAPHLNPPFISAEERDALTEDALPHQKEARRTGMPSLGAGAIYPVNISDLLVPAFPIPEHWARGWAMDVGWNRTAAIFGVKDEDTGQIFLTNEYYVGEAQPIVHTHGIKSLLSWPDLVGCIDPAAEIGGQRDGTKLRYEYEDLGLELRKADNAVSAGIMHVLTLMQSGLLKVFDHLTNWKTEFRLYRRDEKGKIVKENDHLMDSMRYLLFTPGAFVTRQIQLAHRSRQGEW